MHPDYILPRYKPPTTSLNRDKAHAIPRVINNIRIYLRSNIPKLLQDLLLGILTNNLPPNNLPLILDILIHPNQYHPASPVQEPTDSLPQIVIAVGVIWELVVLVLEGGCLCLDDSLALEEETAAAG